MKVKIHAGPEVLYTLAYCWRSVIRELLALIGGKEERGG